ncbi:MAG: NAD(P)/FAD-dependent oxidoreductase [Flavobacteriales bacterium]
MANGETYDVLIIGGGLAGLACALHLSKNNRKVLLVEKQQYPHHKVCGEYVSMEVVPYLKSLGIDPFSVGAKRIGNFEISNHKGQLLKTKLPLGGFGISRYAFDAMLYNAIKDKMTLHFDTVDTVQYHDNHFEVITQGKEVFKADYVVGAYGKRSNIDVDQHRKFITEKTPWLAVKAHYEYDFKDDTVALHNFNGGYCGLSKTEMDTVNACYLTTYKSFKEFGNIEDFQKQVLSKNPYLKEFFQNAKPLFKKPLTIGQISFDKKLPVENHIFMIGDSAGLIHPLCGNGMAMAIHSAKIFSEFFLKSTKKESYSRLDLETQYTQLWNKTFSNRLKVGRNIQGMLLHPKATNVGFSVAKMFPSILPAIIKRTHGELLV